MAQYFIRRLLLAFPTILLVIFATFLIVRLVPGDIILVRSRRLSRLTVFC